MIIIETSQFSFILYELFDFMNSYTHSTLLLFYQHPVSPRCRVRKQVGMTNRWRLPESLGSDLLGSAQAIRSISMPYNQTLVNIITGKLEFLGSNIEQSPGADQLFNSL